MTEGLVVTDWPVPSCGICATRFDNRDATVVCRQLRKPYDKFIPIYLVN